MTDELKDMFPGSKPFPLNKGKTAYYSLMTITHMRWIQEKYGSFDEFLGIFKKDYMQMILDIMELSFELLENQSDFKSRKEYESLIPMSKIKVLAELLQGLITESVPVLTATKGEESGE